jgi:hypothetical protein
LIIGIGIGIGTIVEPSQFDPDPDPDPNPDPKESQQLKAWRHIRRTSQLLRHCTQDLTQLQAFGALKEASQTAPRVALTAGLQAVSRSTALSFDIRHLLA